LDQLPPEERAFFYQRMGDPQLAQQITQSGSPATSQVKATVDLAKTKIKADHAAMQAHHANDAAIIQAGMKNSSGATQ